MKQVIVNADDLGLSEGTNLAIVELLEAGRLSSATLMANAPAYEDALARLQAMTLEPSIGLHVNLTQHRPVGGGDGLSPFLDQSGRFLGRRSLAMACLRARVKIGALQQEVEAQLRHGEQQGLRIAHLDTHQNAHAIPLVHKALHAVARSHALPVRNLRPFVYGATPGKRIQSALLARINRRNLRANLAPTPLNDYFTSIFHSRMAPSVDAYRQIIAACPGPVVELMVHPARVDDGHRAETDISWISQMDYAVLCTSEWKHLIDSIHTTDYAKLQTTNYAKLQTMG